MILIAIKLKQLILQEAKKVLLEYTMEQAEARFTSKAFRKRANIEGVEPDVAKQNILEQVPQDISERFKADALWWAISTFIKAGQFGAIDSRKKALETFFQIKEAGKGSILSQQDINQIQSWDELKEIVEQAKPAWEEYKQSKASKDWEAGSNLIYEDDTWQVFIPENKGAACKLGKGTDWCTAAPGLNYYEQYHSQEDPLIIFINKQDPEDKYQFHYKTSQFMDKQDEDISENKIFYKLNEIVKKLGSKLPKKTIELANEYYYEALPNGDYKRSKAGEITYYNSNGEYHREGGPAVEGSSGSKFWYLKGKRHREDGPAVEYASGTKKWFLNDKLHREGGPAVEWASGTKEWWLNDKLHREGGPAIEYSNGSKYWYLNGKRLAEDEWRRAVQQMRQEKNLREHFRRFM